MQRAMEPAEAAPSNNGIEEIRGEGLVEYRLVQQCPSIAGSGDPGGPALFVALRRTVGRDGQREEIGLRLTIGVLDVDESESRDLLRQGDVLAHAQRGYPAGLSAEPSPAGDVGEKGTLQSVSLRVGEESLPIASAEERQLFHSPAGKAGCLALLVLECKPVEGVRTEVQKEGSLGDPGKLGATGKLDRDLSTELLQIQIDTLHEP